VLSAAESQRTRRVRVRLTRHPLRYFEPLAVQVTFRDSPVSGFMRCYEDLGRFELFVSLGNGTLNWNIFESFYQTILSELLRGWS